MRIFQKGFNFGQDGPGNRLVYHLQGCNMHCLWCSNPEGMKINGGTDYSVEEIFNECKRSKMLFYSGGGVTFTGGEATLQHDELLALLKLLKSDNIHTCIETNGTSPMLCELIDYIDYLIMDFKHFDSTALKKYTGVENNIIKDNFEYNCKISRQQHIRIPLINNINTDFPENFAKYFSNFNTSNIVFEFLPYHEFGKDKWTDEYKIIDGFIPDEKLKEFTKIFKEYNLRLITT